MIQKAEQLYQLMLGEMEKCKDSAIGEMTEIECRFTIANKYWAMLRNDLQEYEFPEVDTEILFFKTIKPKFRAESIYCGLISHALLFKTTATDLALLQKFWRQESTRLEKFIAANQSFYDGFQNHDPQFEAASFTRRSHQAEGIDRASSSPQDHLVSNLLALEKYMEYVRKELRVLSCK